MLGDDSGNSTHRVRPTTCCVRRNSCILAVIMPTAKRRLLFLITTADWGGAQMFVFQTALAAKQHGHDVMIAAGEAGELGDRCTQAGLRFEQLHMVKRNISPLYDLAAIHEIRQLLREWKPGAVHLNSSKMSVVGSIAASLEKIPCIIYRIGGWAFLEDLPAWKKQFYLLAEKWTASKKDIIVTVHPGDEDLARKLKITPRGPLMTIPNGIDLVRFDRELLVKGEARRRLGLALDKLVIGTIANYYPPKDIPGLLETIAPLARSNENLQFVIIGDGPEREAVQTTFKKLNLENRIILAGRLEDAQQYLSAFDIFLLASTKEGMPWTLLEAMAARLPCIATDVGACRWMIGTDAGIIVPPKQPMELQKAITQLVNSEETRKALGAAARSAIEKRFRWEATEAQTLALFE